MAATAPAEPPHTVLLDYTEVSYSMLNEGLSVSLQTHAFPKEPPLVGRQVRRGSLRFQIAGEHNLPFLWDIDKGQLYLDLNRNGDLTDDPSGVFASAVAQAASGYYQYGSFTNVHLTSKTDGQQRRSLVDLNFTDYGGRLNAYAAVRSLYAGELTLDQHPWQVGVIGNTQGKLDLTRSYLLLRPWNLRNDPFNVNDGLLNTAQFSKRLFVQSHLYAADCTRVTGGDAIRYQFTLEEESAELGELHLIGQSIQRVILTGGPCLVVLDAPKDMVHVPVGGYGGYQVRVGREGISAHSERVERGANRAVVVERDHAVTLTAGGPLTNTVNLSRRGSYLVLDYRLVGADGAPYQLGTRDYQRPPRFTIFLGDKQIASGKFEFG